MLAQLSEFYHAITAVSTFTVVVLTGLVIAAYALLKMSSGSLLLGSIFLPAFIFGGLSARYFLARSQINLLNDPDANEVLYLAIGVLASLIVMTVIVKIFGAIQEARYARRRPSR